MRFQLSPLITVTLKHSYIRDDGQIYWQRKIPKRHLARYPSSAPLKRNLLTKDPAVAARKIALLDKEHEAIWREMDRDPEIAPLPAREAARKLLQSHGIDSPRHTDEAGAEAFFETLEAPRIAFAETQPDPEEAYRWAPVEDYLDKPAQEALRMLQGSSLFLFSDAIEVYLAEHENAGRPSFDDTAAFTRTCCAKFTKLLGDKALTDYTRDDAKSFRNHLLTSGLKTASVKRNMTPVKAVFRKAIAEKGLQVADIWAKLPIQGFGEDSTRRSAVGQVDLDKLRTECREADDDIRWLVALLLDVGARLAEVAGLRLVDIHADAQPVPYVEFYPHAARSLKGESRGHTFSRRRVPLVGASLWAAQRITAQAKPGQVFAFPRYLSAEGYIKSDSASAAVNKWLSARGYQFTSHSFRHTMRDRLRNANAPKPVQDEVGGWARESIGESYGEGTALSILQGWLLRSLTTAEGAPFAAASEGIDHTS